MEPTCEIEQLTTGKVKRPNILIVAENYLSISMIFTQVA
jgi:hypothetical protein